MTHPPTATVASTRTDHHAAAVFFYTALIGSRRASFQGGWPHLWNHWGIIYEVIPATVRIMHRTYEYRCLPTGRQSRALDELLELTRQLYNAALQERRDAYQKTGKSISYFDQCKALTQIRKDDPTWAAISLQIGRGALQRVHLAFQSFFRRVREKASRVGYPRFKSKDRHRTLHLGPNYHVTHMIGQDGQPNGWAILQFKGLPGKVRVWLHRPIPADAEQKATRLVKDAKGWKLQIVLAFPDVPLHEPTVAVGIDVGVEKFLTTSDGDQIPNPRLLEKKFKVLRREQRSLARKKRGSGNRARQKQVVARLHEQVRHARADFHWKTAAWLVTQGKTLVVEDLNIRGLARGRLSRQIHDVGWGDFLRRLACKAESAGLPMVKVNPAYTSQDWSGCGERVPKPLRVRVHDCPYCGRTLDRDQNAAMNIRRAGDGPLGVKAGSGRLGLQVQGSACI